MVKTCSLSFLFGKLYYLYGSKTYEKTTILGRIMIFCKKLEVILHKVYNHHVIKFTYKTGERNESI